MKSTNMLCGAAYEPEVTAALFEAFDGVWHDIGPHYTAQDGEVARVKLARIILSLAAEGELNPEVMKTAALETMLKPGS